MRTNNKSKVMRLTGMGLLTAVVIVLQMLGAFIRFGPFSISLVLIPIVVGAAMYGVGAGAWLGLIFGAAVLLSGDAAAFLAISIPGTVITVLAKGLAAGALSGLVFRLLDQKNTLLATIAAAVVCPVVNTGVFLLGCATFFLDTIQTWAGGQNTFVYMIVGLVGLNFVVELLMNVVLAPTAVHLIELGRKYYTGKRS